jgi:hypothetical protein
MKSLRKDSFYQKLANLKASFKSLKNNSKKREKKEKKHPRMRNIHQITVDR